MKLLKIAAVNILIFLGLIIFLNLTVITIYQLSHLKLSSHASAHSNWKLPNYKNIEWARAHSTEWSNLKSEYRSYIGWRRLPYKGQTINIDEKGIRMTPQSEFVTTKSPLVIFSGG